MTEILNAVDVLNRVHELDNYISQSLDVLKSLRVTKDDAEKIYQSLSLKMDELVRREQDFSDYLKTIQVVSQKADAIMSPIVQGKEELERLDKKVNEQLETIGGEIEKTIGSVTERLSGDQKALEEKLNDLVATLRKESEAINADVLRQQQEALTSLSQQIEAHQNASDAHQGVLDTHRATMEKHQTALEGQSKKVEQLRKDVAELVGAVQESKANLEKQRQEFADSLKKIHDEQKLEFETALTELREKHIKVLEKDDAQIKTALNGVIKKLSNVKFKKMLGLD